MYGRLGNQFFRYAVARSLQLDFYPNEKLIINFNQVNESGVNDSTFRDYLQDYNVVPYETYNKKGKVMWNETSPIQKLTAAAYYSGLKKYTPADMKEEYVYEKKWANRLNKYGLYWFRDGYFDLGKSNCLNKIVSGNFEAPGYFDKYKDILKKEFTPKYPRIEKNANLYEKIEKNESVCVSIRRGDFETNTEFKKIHSICNRDYFLEAIERINAILVSRGKKPVYILFSDDIEWAKNNVITGYETYFEDGTDPVWEKLRMMSLCKHFILSNSTFSWWSQYLSASINKIVVSPSRQYNNNFKSPLIDENWVLIKR